MTFFEKLTGAIERHQSLLYVGLDPDPEVWPKHYGSWETVSRHLWGLQEWLQFLITETADLACAYKLTLEFYRALGASGLELLSQTLKAIPAHIPVILDAQHSGLNTSTIFAQTIFAEWQVDAVTLNAYTGQDEVAPFLLYPDKAVFILCVTANPSAAILQEYPTAESPFYLQLVKEAQTWGTPEQVGLEVGVSPEVLARVRSLAPERLILAGDLSTEGSDLNKTLEAGLNANGDGLLVPVPQEWLSRENLREPIRTLRDEINQVRVKVAQGNPTCSVWLPDVCLLEQHPHKELILQLYDIGCLHFGEFVQASGATFPYYIDLRTIISHPQVFEQVLSAYAEILSSLSFDRIAGIPYGSLPTATGLGLRLNFPLVFPRKEVKAHGTRRLVEGKFCEGETVVVIDDILITGRSVTEGAKKLESVGLKVQDIVVLIDHEEGVRERLENKGYRSHAVLKISEIAQTLSEAGRLKPEQLQLLLKTPA
ncbi:MAG: bifunctional orotidine-5'-phosphate decarboxylase/orotate phosphoribosyltransferase [Xenococcaceae cyanobacterium MO_234.B1]|nr:bifunctional orotidine-5'-phosphate decarboxylase/orotate phosphoribosyltransferase [Xenococcaceae cyanobacterium MO_234.B1]